MKEKPIVTRLKERIKKEFSEINLGNFGISLTNGKDCGTLKDILEKNVDEKYYVDPKLYKDFDESN